MKTSERGQALVGLLIILSIGAIFLGLAATSMVGARCTLDEQAARATLRRVDTAIVDYSQQYTTQYPPYLNALVSIPGQPDNAYHVNMLNTWTVAPTHSGYLFTYVALDFDPAAIRFNNWVMTAVPETRFTGSGAYAIGPDHLLRRCVMPCTPGLATPIWTGTN